MKRSGQALVEFVVAIIAVLVVFAFLLQIGTLSRAHTEVMAEAREEAGSRSMLAGLQAGSPEFINQWDNGPDEVNYSVDDECRPGSLSDFKSRTVSYARPVDLSETVGDNMISALSVDPEKVMDGLMDGHGEATVTVLPAVRSLIYAADEIDIKSDVWMVNGGGIY